jgi:hypothetical protein
MGAGVAAPGPSPLASFQASAPARILPGADLKDMARGRGVVPEPAYHPARVTQVQIDPAQIPAASDGARIRGIQRIQNLGKDDTVGS